MNADGGEQRVARPSQYDVIRADRGDAATWVQQANVVRFACGVGGGEAGQDCVAVAQRSGEFRAVVAGCEQRENI
jgi:hypothetical protein